MKHAKIKADDIQTKINIVFNLLYYFSCNEKVFFFNIIKIIQFTDNSLEFTHIFMILN